MALEFGAFRDEITKYDTFRYMGKIEKIVGMTIEASGPACNIGDVCRIYSKDMTSFIRAEVVSYDTLVAEGSMAACKEKGLVRSEGKDYVMQDGDIVLFRFNV